MADGACFEMHIAVATITVGAGGPLKIADHRESHACVPGKFLPKAEPRSRDALIASLDLLQFGGSRPVPVDAGFEPLDAMRVQIKLDERCPGKIRNKRLACCGKDCRELRQ